MNYSINRGLRIGPLKMLQPVLKKWQKLNEDRSWFKAGDAPWWYNERATLSVFAGAVWRCGGQVLEEFSAKKVTGSKSGKASHKIGRCDIWFGISESEFVAEAKQCWPRLSGSTQNARRTVEASITEARREVMRVPDWGYRRLGITFAAPLVHVSKQEEISQYLRAFILQLLAIKYTTIAWVFPKAARSLRPSSKESANRDYVFPGVVMLLY